MATEDVQQAISEAKDLVKMLETTSVRRFSIAIGDFKIMIERGRDETTAPPAAAHAAAVPAQAEVPDHLHHVPAPMVGTFYRARSPGEKPFVEEGSRVEKGQTIGIVEAMKVLNEVASGAEGIVVEILVPDGQFVEFEQPLIVVDTQA